MFKIYQAKNPKIYPNDPHKRAIHFYLLSTKKLDTLSVGECEEMLSEAGITIWDVGKKSNQYALARYGDTGEYTRDNCRFITVRENTLEREDRTPEELEQRRNLRRESSEKTMKKLGRTEQLSRPVVFRGKEYPSLNECSRATGIARWSLKTAKKYKADLKYL